MARFKIYSKDGQTVRYEGCPKYNGTYLKVSYLEFSSIASPTPIVWQVGDYVDYPRTGLRYTLRSIPSVRKKAKSGQTGDAFVYQNVQFMAQTQDLAVAPFVDLVPGDNGVHFSTQSAVSTFENAYGIAARIQACLDDLFPGVWDVKVYENLDGDFEKKISEAVDFSIDGGTCLEACDRMYDTWGIGWTHYKDSISGKDVLLFGRPNTRTSDNTSPDFIFGPGSGLTALKKSVANSDEIGTRLRVFGSSRNIPTSYYRGLDIYNGEGADIQNLMIPLSKWGKTDGKPDARKAYLQAPDDVVAALGLIPRTHYFDGSDGEEIYPSLEGATVGDVRAAKQELQDTTYVPSQTVYPDASERVDEIEAAANPEDDGYSGGSDGSKYKDTQVVSYAGVNRQQVHVSSNVRPEQYGDPTEVSYYIFSQVPLSKDDAVTVESGMEGYIEDANGIIYSDAGSVKVVLTLQSGTSTNGNLASKSVETTKEGNRYNFRLPEITLEHPSDYTDMSLRLTITVKASRSANSFFYVNLSGHDFLLGEYTPIKGDFTLTLKQIGFDISQRAPLTADGLARIYMVDGMNAGRSFYVRSCSYTSDSDTWLLGMYRTEDESTGMRYPNSQFPINPGDHFLLLDIAMPELYVGLASQRLYEKGIEMLNDISRVKPYYEPEVDAIVMTEQARVLREGMYMRLTDADIAGDSSEYVLIDTLTINEGEAEIPTYKVGLREYKKKTFQETTKAAIDDISQKASGGSSGRPSSSTAQSYDALSDKPKIDGVTLEGDRDSYNELGLINKSIFELVNIGTEGNPLMAIRAKYGLFSDSFISARGSDPEAGSGGSGGLDVQAMWYALGQPTGEQINASHIPSLAISKITGLQAALNSKLESITKAMVEGVLTGTITSHNHDGRYAPLSGGLVPSQYLPSYVDDVVEYASLSAFPASGEGGKIYVALDTNLTYRWGGTSYVEISPSLALGHTSGTAYPGDEGAALAERVESMKVITDLFGIDGDGNVYVKDNRGFYGNSFVSARGSDPGAGSGGGSGVDMESVWYALGQPTNEKINVSHIPALQQLSGQITNAQLANSSLSVAGVTVALGGAVSTKQIASALTAAGYKLTDTVTTLASLGITATAAELNFVDGVTSNIQTQLNAKANASALTAYALKDGSNASGTWAIDISRTATYATVLSSNSSTTVSTYLKYRMIGGQTSLVGSNAANGAWCLPTTGGDAKSGNGQILRFGWAQNYYTDLHTGPNEIGSNSGLQFRQVVAGAVSSLGWRTLLDTANYSTYLDTRYLLKSAYTASDILAKLKTVDGPGSGLDADLLDGYHLSSVRLGVSDFGAQIAAAGWYRVYTSSTTNAQQHSDIILHLQRGYVSPQNEHYTFSISVGFNGDINITQLSGVIGGHLITKIRVVWANSQKYYIDIYTDYRNHANWYSVYGQGYGTFSGFTAGATIPSGYSSYEFTTVEGCKSSGGFTGALSGNATSASKLATARSIWGQTFDGTQGVDGHLYLGSPTYRLYFGTSGLTSYLTGEDSGYFSIKSANNTAVAATLLRINLSNGVVSGSGISLSSHLAVSGAEGRGITYTGKHIRLKAATGGWAIGIEPYHNDDTTSFSHSVGGAFGGNANTINYTYYGGTYNSPAMVILPNKMVGIGRTDPWYTLDVNGTIRAAVGIWSNGYVSAKGQDTTSDARYKKDIAALPAQAALAVLMRLRPSTWAWRDDGHRGAGFVAQEVTGVLPEAVREVGNGEDRHLALNYQMLHAYEVSALQTHETELERLRGRVNQLENEIKRIRHES